MTKTNSGGHHPDVDDMISLRIPSTSRVTSNGSKVAFTVRTTDWAENRYENHCFVFDAQSGDTFPLTRTGDVTDLHWIGDSSLAILKGNPGKDEKPQIWLFEKLMGEGLQITDHEEGVQSFRPFADGILFVADDPERKLRKERGDRYGNFTVFEGEESASALYYTGFNEVKDYIEKVRAGSTEAPPKPIVELSRTFEKPMKILSFIPSRQDDAIYINCRSKDYPVYHMEASSYMLRLDAEAALKEHLEREGQEPADEGDTDYIGELTRLNLPEGASVAAVSSDGAKLLIRHKERDNKSYTQADYWILEPRKVTGSLEEVDLGAEMVNITADLDGSASLETWIDDGIYVGYSDSTTFSVTKVSEAGEIEKLDLKGVYPMWGVHISEGGYLTYIGNNASSFPEVYASTEPISSQGWELRRLTSLGEQVEGWEMGKLETIRWESRDGTMIEGVLRKPVDFDPSKKYPLVFVVHGGPSAASKEYLLEGLDYARYPVVQLVNRDVLVLKPNYRGSIGRGQAFQELNVENLGVGDLWDLESGIDHLIQEGIVDDSRVGCMGWSQGGYISAMASTHSDRFCAISVGAGISDWYTYHITTDIPHFTKSYLSGSPFRDLSLYVKTAPMTKISEAKTPTIIQHGAKDQRVPFTNATELYRGLKEMGVPTKLFVYSEMAHPITKPRECRAVMEQNLTWFNHYIFGDELQFPE